MARMTKEEKKWQAQSDAFTLMEAEAIKSKKTRLKAALGQVKQISKEKEKEAEDARKLSSLMPKTRRKKRIQKARARRRKK